MTITLLRFRKKLFTLKSSHQNSLIFFWMIFQSLNTHICKWNVVEKYPCSHSLRYFHDVLAYWILQNISIRIIHSIQLSVWKLNLKYYYLLLPPWNYWSFHHICKFDFYEIVASLNNTHPKYLFIMYSNTFHIMIKW